MFPSNLCELAGPPGGPGRQAGGGQKLPELQRRGVRHGSDSLQSISQTVFEPATRNLSRGDSDPGAGRRSAARDSEPP
jgi:hypothetical protein